VLWNLSADCPFRRSGAHLTDLMNSRISAVILGSYA